MDDAQRQAFRERGYIVVDDALSPAQVAELNALYDAVLAGEAPPEFDGPNVKSLRGSSAGKNMPLSSVIADRHGRQYEGRRFWGQPYVDLIDLPTVLPILEELLGQPSWEHAPRAVPVELRSRIRLDHDNIHHQAAHTGGTEHLSESADEAAVERKMRGSSLHGGPTAHHITCVYELKSVGKGEGGFGCLPGSHKPEHNEKVEQLPEGWRQQWANTPWTSRDPDWPQHEIPIHRIEAKAGQCIIFTEKMKHGTIPWSGKDERRTIFYKYVPFGMHHNDAGYDVTDPALTPRQQEIVEFPPVFFNERDIDGEVMQVGPSKDTGQQRTAPLRHPDVQTVETWHMNWREAARL